jgi:hypothetical protein
MWIALGIVICTMPMSLRAADFENVGHAGPNFLQIPVDAQGTALANANIAMVKGVRGLYWNPGAIALAGGNEVLFSYADWILDTRLTYAAAVVNIGSFGTAGVSFNAFAMDDMEVTTEEEPDGTGEYFGAGDYAIGLSYGYQITDRFSWGVTAKFVHEYIWDNSTSTFGFDVGSVYRTDFYNMRIGMLISNFGGNLEMDGDQIDDRIAEEEDADVENNPRLERLAEEYVLPQYFNVGIALDPYHRDDHRVTVAVMTNDPNDNATRVSFGLEYGFKEMFCLRGGYKIDYDEQGFSAGAGFQLEAGSFEPTFDYAYTDFGILGDIHHFSLSVGF